MLDHAPPPPSQNARGAVDPDCESNHGETLLSVMWRYRLVAAIVLPLSLSLGYWVNCQKPTTYRSASKLMFKSDTPLTLDSSTGAISGGMPSGSLMQSLISSDAIAGRVTRRNEDRRSRSVADMTDAEFVSLVRRGIRFQPVTTSIDSRERMIASISYEGEDPDLCVAAVESVSRAIADHFKEEREVKINEFSKLIGRAQEKLLPDQAGLEDRYQEFRERAPLEWDPDGHVINPHRQRQIQLQDYRDQIERKIRDLDCEYRFVRSMRHRHDNPLMIALIIGQLSDVFKESPLMLKQWASPRLVSSDLELQQIEVEKDLIPLMIRREQLETQYGSAHPEVRGVATQIEASHRKLNDLIRQSVERRKELSSESQLMGDGEGYYAARVVRAKEAIEAYTGGLTERLLVAGEDIAKLDKQIANEKQLADELKQFEDTDASYRRQIAAIGGMLNQLEDQLSALKLVDTNGGILVEKLRDTGEAQVTGPWLKQDLGVFAMIGLGISAMLSILFDASARTYRTADSIQQSLNAPVLAHIPVDEVRGRKGKSSVDPTLIRLDPKLAVIHRPHCPAAEAVRGVRTALLLDQRQHQSQVFQITSPLPGDGKSTLAANVGCAIAQTGKRTLVVDLDLRSPRLSLRFNLDSKIGLANVLNGEIGVAQAVHETPIDNLDVLPCGPLPSNPAEALTLPEIADVMQWARDNYDIVIVDTPPLLMVSDPTIVTTHVDAAIMVMRIRRRCKPNAKEAIGMLRWSGTRVMGIVINKFRAAANLTYTSGASGSYQSVGYGYGDKYRRRYQQEVNAQDTYVVKGSGANNRVDLVKSGAAMHPKQPHVSHVASRKR